MFELTMTIFKNLIKRITVAEAPLGQAELTADDRRRLYAALHGFLMGISKMLTRVDVPRKRELDKLFANMRESAESVYQELVATATDVDEVYKSISKHFELIAETSFLLDFTAMLTRWSFYQPSGVSGGVYR